MTGPALHKVDRAVEKRIPAGKNPRPGPML